MCKWPLGTSHSNTLSEQERGARNFVLTCASFGTPPVPLSLSHTSKTSKQGERENIGERGGEGRE